jgi:hypothetical protein
MTDDDRRAALAISPNCVTYLPGSYDKMFARAMAALAAQPDATLTDNQRRLLWSKVVRYRRQIPDKSLVALAKEHTRELAEAN